MSGLPLWLLLVIFVAAGAVIWVAGIQLSKSTDVLDSRLHLGSALGGLIGPFHQLRGFWAAPGDVVWVAAMVLMVVAVVLTITSGVEFARDAWTQSRAARDSV